MPLVDHQHRYSTDKLIVIPIAVIRPIVLSARHIASILGKRKPCDPHLNFFLAAPSGELTIEFRKEVDVSVARRHGPILLPEQRQPLHAAIGGPVPWKPEASEYHFIFEG